MDLTIKVKVTKQLYKSFDSYERYQKWIGKNLIKLIRRQYE